MTVFVRCLREGWGERLAERAKLRIDPEHGFAVAIRDLALCPEIRGPVCAYLGAVRLPKGSTAPTGGDAAR